MTWPPAITVTSDWVRRAIARKMFETNFDKHLPQFARQP
jgi:hypothetical protein